MARQRRITELIQDEVEKPNNPQPVDGVIDVTATDVDKTEVKSTKSTKNAVNSQSQTVDKATQIDPVVVKEVIKEIIDPNPELEAKIKQLQIELKQAVENAIALREELTNTKQNLSEQTAVSSKLEQELQRAKQDAVHLAASNQQLSQQVAILEEEKAALLKQIEASKPKQSSHIQPLKSQPSTQIQKSTPASQHVPVRKTDRIYRDRFFARVPPTPTPKTEDTESSGENSGNQMWLLD